jgi:hypothetical protein
VSRALAFERQKMEKLDGEFMILLRHVHRAHFIERILQTHLFLPLEVKVSDLQLEVCSEKYGLALNISHASGVRCAPDDPRGARYTHLSNDVCANA